MKAFFREKSKAEIWISTAGIAVLTALLIYWWITDSNVNRAGHVAALASFVLFVGLCLRFVPVWLADWTRKEPVPEIKTAHDGKKFDEIKIFVFFLLIGPALILIARAVRVAVFKDTVPFLDGLETFLYVDVGYYLDIAEHWYTAIGENRFTLVFYPGFPLLVKGVNLLVGNYLYSAFITADFFYACSALLMYRLLLLDYPRKTVLRVVKYLAILPAAFFFVVPQSESLFLFLSIGSVYLARKDHWLFAGATGAFAAFTRSLGVLVFIPLFFEAVSGLVNHPEDRRKWLFRTVAAFIVPLGTVLYLFINYQVTGNPFAFSDLEAEKWGQSMGLFFDTTAFQIDNALADLQQPWFTNSLGLWLPNVAYCFASLILMFFAANKIRSGYSAWFIAYYFIAIGATYLISAPRYLVACFPLYPALAEAAGNKKTDRILTGIFLITAMYYFFAFLAHWEVY